MGTSSVRASVVREDGTIEREHRAPLPSDVPAPGLVEFDADAMATKALSVAAGALAGGAVATVGITTQRASTVAWSTSTGKAIGPGLGWQDLRTAGTCLELQAEAIRLSPSESATKAAWLLDNFAPSRPPDVKVGTVDSWIAWHLSQGDLHVTDRSNAAVTGLFDSDATTLREDVLSRLRIPGSCLPEVVDSSGRAGKASALSGAPRICSIIGDQQASMVGQGCTRPGLAKCTFGTGAMLDVCLGSDRPSFPTRGEQGCFPIVAWSREGRITWGTEAIMLVAGSAVDWLVEDLGVLNDAAESETVALSCDDTGGVMMVPALLGLGTPSWDFGARGSLLGLTRGSTRAQLVRAVLEGVANSAADLLEAAETDARAEIATLRVDGGMTANRAFLQALADACGRPVEVSSQLEATTLGAAYLAGLESGVWRDEDEIAELWDPKLTVEPVGAPDRAKWTEALERSKSWYPELTAVQF